jgi:hypothetical protein
VSIKPGEEKAKKGTLVQSYQRTEYIIYTFVQTIQKYLSIPYVCYTLGRLSLSAETVEKVQLLPFIEICI